LDNHRSQTAAKPSFLTASKFTGLLTASLVKPGFSKLGSHHVSFLRACIQGVEPVTAARRYLFSEDEITTATTVRLLADLRNHLYRASLITDQGAKFRALPIGRLIYQLRQPNLALANKAPIAGHFEQWASLHPDWGIEELRSIYLDQFPDLNTKSAERRPTATNMDAALMALNELAAVMVSKPARDQALSAWLAKKLEKKFSAAGLATVGDLVDFVNSRGFSWYRSIGGIGHARAKILVMWLKEHSSLLSPTSLAPRTRITTAAIAVAQSEFSHSPLLPFERLVVGYDLDGHDGALRAPLVENLLGTDTDHGAIQRWLESQALNVHTRRSYAREIERFYAFCLWELGKPLSSVLVDDCLQYRAFLISLRDVGSTWPWKLRRDQWVGRRNYFKADPNWRPFADSQKRASIERTLVIIKSCFAYLQNTGYLRANPWALVPIALKGHKAFALESAIDKTFSRRSLDAAALTAIELAVDNIEDPTRRARFRCLLHVTLGSGMRRSEVSNATVAWLERAKTAPTEIWVLHPIGKGNKQRSVVLTEQAVNALKHYFTIIGFGDDFMQLDTTTPLLGRTDNPTIPLSAESIYALLKQLFAKAMQFADTNTTRRTLSKASTHWLRHTFGTSIVEDYPITDAQYMLGHASLTTTQAYVAPRIDSIVERYAARRATRSDSTP
jgi:site-specific recombinase XerD